MTRDTWEGKTNIPISYDVWVYGYGNPVTLLDPSGKTPIQCTHIDPDDWDQVPGCEGYTPSPPGTGYYNQQTPPRNITWVSNSYADSIATNLAPGLAANTPGAQFGVPGHPYYCDYDANGNCTKRHNDAYCGDIALAAILSAYGKHVDVRQIVEQLRGNLGLPGNEGTSADQLSYFINTYYSSLQATKTTPPISPFYRLGQWIGEQLDAGNVLMTLVYIASGSSGYSPQRSATNQNLSNIQGRISGKGSIDHWVVITGRSYQWQDDTPDVFDYPEHASPWNWIRVFNPFGNQTEYYWWGDFLPAWSKFDSGGYNRNWDSTVVVGFPH